MDYACFLSVSRKHLLDIWATCGVDEYKRDDSAFSENRRRKRAIPNDRQRRVITLEESLDATYSAMSDAHFRISRSTMTP
jgi:hypothetical protein